MSQFHSFLDQSDQNHSYHPPIHSAHPDLVIPERSGQKKISTAPGVPKLKTITNKASVKYPVTVYLLGPKQKTIKK